MLTATSWTDMNDPPDNSSLFSPPRSMTINVTGIARSFVHPTWTRSPRCHSRTLQSSEVGMKVIRIKRLSYEITSLSTNFAC